MNILAIDPGNLTSGWLIYETESKCPLYHGIEDNDDLLAMLEKVFPMNDVACEYLAIEMMACYGMPVGKDVLETCVWIGRFIQAWGRPEYELVYRIDVRMALCKDSRAKDGNIRQAIIDLYPPTGGGNVPQIGIKKKPGPLYGISKDVWSALAIAITAEDSITKRERSHQDGEEKPNASRN